MEFFEFDIKKCNEAKEKLGKFDIVGDIWRGNFAPSNNIGNCTYLWRLHLPKDAEDFYNKYIKYAEDNTDLKTKYRGLTYEELYKLAERYKKTCDSVGTIPQFDLWVYFYDALTHIIVETNIGRQKELIFRKWLTQKGFDCSEIDADLDTRYGIDIRAIRDDGRVFFLQVKPYSFIASHRYDVLRDRKKACKKYVETKNKFGLKTHFVVYESITEGNNNWWIKDDSFCIPIKKLFKFDENDPIGTFEDIRHDNVNFVELT